MREQLEQKWNTDDWKGKAKVNTNNRSLSDGLLHTGVSIPTTEHYKRMNKSSDMTPSCWDLFQKTHKIKGDTLKWVSSKSGTIINEYERQILERDSQEALGDDVSSHQSDNNMVVGGVDKKGRIYSLGPKAAKYKPSSSTSFIGISPSKYEEMKTQVSNLTAENKALKDKLDMIAATQEQMRQFMETFSLTHPSPLVPPPPPPPPPPAPTNEDDQQDDDEFYDELGADL